jgi:4-amino-4-deoxy-L-arabinose transferase-like glycosyltransferase
MNGLRSSGGSDLGRLLVLTVAVGVFVLPGIGARDLWNPDEPRYAEVAREMLQSTSPVDLLVPRLDGRLYTQKPPLHFWNVALAGSMRGGVDETAARLPSFVACVLAAWGVFLLGRTLFSEPTAWLGALVFSTCGQVQVQARVGQIDMTLAALIALGVSQWASAHFGGRPARVYWFWALSGVATVAKGPVGLLPALLAILVFLAVERDRDGLRRLRLGRGLLLWLAVVLAWFAPAVAIAGRKYFDAMIFEQTLERYALSGGHLRPWYHYLRTLPGSFAPFTFLVPAAAAALWSERRGETWRRAVRFLVLWIVVTVVFFSLSSGKRTVYMVPTLAPLSLLLAHGIERVAAGWPRRRAATIGSIVLLLSLLVTAWAAVPRAVVDLPDPDVFGRDLVGVARWVLVPFVAGTLVALLVAARGRVRTATAAIGLGVATTFSFATAVLLPRGDTVKSARALAETFAEVARPEEPYAIYPLPDAAFLFYSRRFSTPVHGEEQLRDFAARHERVWLLIERDELAALDPPIGLVEVARDADWEEGHVLLTTAPWPRTSGGSHER